MFSLVGTVFLWIMWPSFNACTAVPGQAQHRAILNSYFSLCSCVVTTLVASAAFNRDRKFELEHVQNATLAGGVVIGVCADLIVEPYGALIVGGLAGVISTLGFKYVTVRWLSHDYPLLLFHIFFVRCFRQSAGHVIVEEKGKLKLFAKKNGLEWDQSLGGPYLAPPRGA